MIMVASEPEHAGPRPVRSSPRMRRACAPAQARGGAARPRDAQVAVPGDHHARRLILIRLSEIRLLRREHVHFEQGVVMLPRAKAGARPVILSDAAQKILRGRLEGNGSEWVFPGPDCRPYDHSYIGRVFRKASRAAGLRDFHFHDLRHHGATMALNRGFTAPIVMALGGWKTERMMRPAVARAASV